VKKNITLDVELIERGVLLHRRSCKNSKERYIDRKENMRYYGSELAETFFTTYPRTPAISFSEVVLLCQLQGRP
jgi:hypothetical protein